MKGILIYDKASAAYNQGAINIYLQEAKKNSITLSLVYYENLSYGIRDNALFVEYEGKPLNDIEFVINRCKDYRLARQFEAIGIRVFNNANVNKLGNNKWETYEYLSRYHIPMPDTMFVPNEKLKAVLSSLKAKAVVKAVHGHGGNQVCLYQQENSDSVEDILRIMKGEDTVIQPFIKGKGQDLRVYVIGQTIIGAVLRTATKDFRSNYSLGGMVEPYELNPKELCLVRKIIDCFSFDYVGIDFIIKEDGSLLFNEIEDVVGARMLYQCTDIDAISIYMNHINQVLVRKRA